MRPTESISTDRCSAARKRNRETRIDVATIREEIEIRVWRIGSSRRSGWANAVHELLVRRIADATVVVRRRVVRTEAVSVWIVVLRAKQDWCPWKSRVPGENSTDAPAAKRVAEKIVTPAENRQIPNARDIDVVRDIVIRRSTVEPLSHRRQLLRADFK